MILRESDLPELARKLQPFLIPAMRAIGTSGGRNTVSGGAATMEAHELASTSALGAYHTVSGLTAGQVLRATASNAASFGQLLHTQLGGVGANDHHAQVHGILGSDHTYSGGAALDVFGLTAASTIGKITPSAAPGAAAALLRTTAGGLLTLQDLNVTVAVTTPTLDTVSGNLVLSPASGVTTLASLHASTLLRTPLLENAAGDLKFNASTNLIRLQASSRIQSDNYASQTTGWGIDYAGSGDFRYLYTDELHAKSFIADLEQALAGGQIISKSVAMVSHDFTVPAAGVQATLRVRDLPSAPNMPVFVAGDHVRLRTFSRSGGSLTIADAWGTVAGYGDQPDGTQTWAFTRSSGSDAGSMPAGTVIAADSLALDYGVSTNGFYEVNAIDGAYGVNSPYLQFVTWTTHPHTGQTVRLRLGNLRGLTSQAGEYGLYAGSGMTDADQYIRLSSYTNRLNNLPMQWWESGALAVSVDTADGVRLQVPTDNISAQRSINFFSGSSRLGYLSAIKDPVVSGGAYPVSGDTWLALRNNGITGKQSPEVSIQAFGSATPMVTLVAGDGGDLTHSSLKLVYGASPSVFVYTAGPITLNGARVNAPAGTVAAPGVNFGYSDTGIYGPADGRVAIACDGTQRLLADTSGVSVTGNLSATGNISMGNSAYLSTDEVRGRDADGLRLADDAGNPGIFVKDGGSVAIGHTNPTTLLHVVALSDGAVAQFAVNDGGDPVGFSIYGYTSDYGTAYLQSTVLFYASSTTSNLNIVSSNANGEIRLSTAGFNSNSYERVRVTKSGSIFNGDTSALYRFQVNGSDKFSAGYTANGHYVSIPNDPLKLTEQSGIWLGPGDGSPSATHSLSSGAECALFMKNDRLILAFRDSGGVYRYFYFDMTQLPGEGGTALWKYTGTRPGD